ncbi:hypothetical protein JCM15908A_10140 [Prevotella dentasini JCM 15908]
MRSISNLQGQALCLSEAQGADRHAVCPYTLIGISNKSPSETCFVHATASPGTASMGTDAQRRI